MRVGGSSLALFVVVVVGCALADLELEGKPCPCLADYMCGADNLCHASAVVGGDGDGVGGADDGDGSPAGGSGSDDGDAIAGDSYRAPGDGDGTAGDGDGASGDGDAPSGDGDATPGNDMTDTSSTSCEECVEAHCAEISSAVFADTLATTLMMCADARACVGDCCVCNADCDLIGANYGAGPCTPEAEAAAGVIVGAGAVVNGVRMTDLCDPARSPDNPCAMTVAYSDCRQANCAAECAPARCL